VSTTPKDHEGFLHCPNGPSQTGRLATQGAAPPPPPPPGWPPGGARPSQGEPPPPPPQPDAHQLGRGKASVSRQTNGSVLSWPGPCLGPSV
jgi:hypothetical protein